MPKLVVMMPAKNAVATVHLAVSTTLKALPPDSCLVVWNDGSSDGTDAVLAKIHDKRLRVMNSEESVGGGAARRAVMGATDSEFIASMDADDVCFPWRFQYQMRAVTNLDLTFMTSVKFGSSLRSIRPQIPVTYSPKETAVGLAFHNPLNHPSLFGRRMVIEDAGGYRDLKLAQDYDLWLRIASRGGRIGRSALPGIAYRRSPTQVSNQLGYDKRITDQEPILRSYLLHMEHLKKGFREIIEHEDMQDATLRGRFLADTLFDVTGEMRPALRLYYRSLIRQGRLGPLLNNLVSG